MNFYRGLEIEKTQIVNMYIAVIPTETLNKQTNGVFSDISDFKLGGITAETAR